MRDERPTDKQLQDAATGSLEWSARYERERKQSALNQNPEYDSLLVRTVKAEVERDRLKATNAEMRALLECICYWHYGPEGEGANERFERIADSFRRDTGMLRPGKDQPGAMGGSPSDEERSKRFREWCDNHHEELATATRAALAAAKAIS